MVACMALGRSECPILLPPPTPPPPSLLGGGGPKPPAAWRRGTGRGGPVSMRTREKKTILKSPQGGRYQARDDIHNHYVKRYRSTRRDLHVGQKLDPRENKSNKLFQGAARWSLRPPGSSRLRCIGMTAIPHLDAASAGARSDTRSDTYGRGFRHGYSGIRRKQTYLSPDGLRDSARRAGTGMPRQKWSGRLGLRHALRHVQQGLPTRRQC